MQNQIEALLKEIEELNNKIAVLETRIDENYESLEEKLDDQMAEYIDNLPYYPLFEQAEEFSDLDELPNYTNENVIILHENCLRTASLSNACKPNGGSILNYHTTLPQFLTPDDLKRSIDHLPDGSYVRIKSNVFSISNEFEKIILDAVNEGKVFFVIFTNDLAKVPQSLREIMRVIK